MLAGSLELAPLLLDLAEEPGVLDGQDRLGGKGLEQVHDLGRKFARLLTPDDQTAHDPLLAKERHGQERAISQPGQDGPEAGEAVFALIQDVGHLHGRPGGRRPADRALPQTDRDCSNGLNQVVAHLVGDSQVELLRGLFILVDDPAGRPRELDRPGDNGGEDRLQIEGRIDGLADLPESFQLLHRPGQLTGPRLQFLEQPDVLDGDDGLIGEG